MNSLNRDTINLKEEHQFSPEILNKDNQTGLCVCGLPQDNPLHGTMNSLNRDRQVHTPRQIVDMIKKQTRPKTWSRELRDWYVAEIINLIKYNLNKTNEPTK